MQLAKIQRDKLILLPDGLKHLRKLGKGILVIAVFGYVNKNINTFISRIFHARISHD